MAEKENIKYILQQLDHQYKCLELNLTITLRKLTKLIHIEHVIESYPQNIRILLEQKAKSLEKEVEKHTNITNNMKIRIVSLKIAIQQNEFRKTKRETKPIKSGKF